MATRAKTKTKPIAAADETPRQKFERLMVARMRRVLNSIRLLGNLSSANYDWDLEEIALIRTAIADQLNLSLARFDKRKPKAAAEFTLPPRVKVEDL